MKKLALYLCLFCLHISCEKFDDSPVVINTGFNHKILEGYFVKSIAFDNQGNAWIGTFKQGLIKYNSDGITVYDATNSTLSDSSVIWDLAVDSKDNIWIGSDGLVKFQADEFTHYTTNNSPIPEDFVSSIAIDSKDQVWFTSCRFRQGGIVKYDGSNWTVFNPDNSELPVHMVTSIAIDHDDVVWLALSETVNNAYLVRIQNDNWKVYTDDDMGFSPYFIADIQMNSLNQVCGAIDYSFSSTLYNNRPQLFIFNGESSIQLYNDSISYVRSVTVDHDDNLWCTTFGGYAVFDGNDWILDDTIFKGHGVFTIEQAPDGSIWIGTGDGVYINSH